MRTAIEAFASSILSCLKIKTIRKYIKTYSPWFIVEQDQTLLSESLRIKTNLQRKRTFGIYISMELYGKA